MNRYAALLRDTWWLWIVIVALGVVLGFTVSFVFFVAIPISFFAFIYFGIMRYDEQGNSVAEQDDG